MQRIVGPVMEEVKQDQGRGIPTQTMGAPYRPSEPYKPPSGKTSGVKSAIDVKKAMMKKNK